MRTVPASTAVMTTMSVWRKTLGLLQPSLPAFIARVMIMEHPKGLTVPKAKARLLTSARTPDKTSASTEASVRFHHWWLLSFCCSCLLCEALWRESSQGGMSPKAAAWRAKRRCYFGSAERAAISRSRRWTRTAWHPAGLYRPALKPKHVVISDQSMVTSDSATLHTRPTADKKSQDQVVGGRQKKNTARMKTVFLFSWLTWERNKYAEKCWGPPDLRNQYPSILQEHKHCFTIVGKKETLDRPDSHFLHFLPHSI